MGMSWLKRLAFWRREAPKMNHAELIGTMTIQFNNAINEHLRGGRKPCKMRFKLNPHAKALFSDELDANRPEDKKVPRETAYDANFHGVPIDWVEGDEPVRLEVTAG